MSDGYTIRINGLSAKERQEVEHSARLAEQLATARRELADARAVLTDLLAERGESWVAQVMERRVELLRALGATPGCLVCGGHSFRHNRECLVAEMRRLVGGPEETQRQVDAAEEAALLDREWPQVPAEVREIYDSVRAERAVPRAHWPYSAAPGGSYALSSELAARLRWQFGSPPYPARIIVNTPGGDVEVTPADVGMTRDDYDFQAPEKRP